MGQVTDERYFDPELKYDFNYICNTLGIPADSLFIQDLYNGAIQDQRTHLQLRRKYTRARAKLQKKRDLIKKYRLKHIEEYQNPLPDSTYRETTTTIDRYCDIIEAIDNQLPQYVNFGSRLISNLIKRLNLTNYFQNYYFRKYKNELKKQLKAYGQNDQARYNYAYWCLNSHASHRNQKALCLIVCILYILGVCCISCIFSLC